MRLWRYLSALAVIIVLSSVLIIKLTSHKQAWERVSSDGLTHKMQTTLEQIYWQWQNEGRPKELWYVKDVKNPPITLTVNKEGVPVFDASEQGCTEVFQLFIGENYPFERVKVAISILTEQPLPETKDGLKNLKLSLIEGDTESRQKLHLCKFEYANRIYFYQLNSGKLTIY